jgi:hypothetical protein
MLIQAMNILERSSSEKRMIGVLILLLHLVHACFVIKHYCSFILGLLILNLMQINISNTEDNINLYDSGHRFEHIPLLLVLLRALPYASRSFQARAIQVTFLLYLIADYQKFQ